MKNYWVKSGILSLLEKFSIQGFALVIVMMLYRLLSKDQVGVWVMFLGIASIIEVARIGLLQNALVKFLTSASDEDYPKIVTASVIINILFTVLTVGFLLFCSSFIAAHYNEPELEMLLKIYALTNIALIPFFQFNYIQQANLDFKGIFYAAFARQCFFFLVVGWLFLTAETTNLKFLAIGYIVASVIGSIVGYIYCKPFLKFSKLIDKVWVKKLLGFGVFVFGTNLLTQIYKNTDKFILGSLPGGMVAVAIYEAAIKITNLTDIPTLSMASILFPQSSRTADGKDGNAGVKELYEMAVAAIMAFMIPTIIIILLFAEIFITILAGAEFIEAANILRITILFGLFIPYAVQFGTVVDSIGRPITNFCFTIFNLVLLIVIDYFFIKWYGLIGAAYGTLLTYGITFVIMQVYLYRELNVDVTKTITNIPFFYKKGFELIKNKGKMVETTPTLQVDLTEPSSIEK